MINVKTREAIDEFNITKNSTNVGEIYDSLEKLRPDKLSSNTIVQLVRYIESFANKNIISAQHYNSFGTGGDKIKTINISTIASIIASNFLNIYKVGTKAVTSIWGSSDFIKSLKSNLYQFPIAIRDKAFYQEGSGYFSLDELGYLYSNPLREARLMIYRESIPDIYKIIFPVSNLTNSSGQVNGVYCSNYIDRYIDVSIALERNSLIVHSTHEIDEIFAGRNLVIRIFNGRLVKSEVNLPEHYVNDDYFEFMSESADIKNHISKFEKILKGECSEDISLTIAYNVACILNLEYQDILLDELVDRVSTFMKSIPYVPV
ncbi:MAG: hypothetical protein ACKPH1_15745 [Microcystis panniformis]